jgi:hypothetical protein
VVADGMFVKFVAKVVNPFGMVKNAIDCLIAIIVELLGLLNCWIVGGARITI